MHEPEYMKKMANIGFRTHEYATLHVTSIMIKTPCIAQKGDILSPGELAVPPFKHNKSMPNLDIDNKHSKFI